MFAEAIASRLRTMRKTAGHRQQRVAESLGLSVSAVSRLERGIRGLRVEQLVAWAGTLGYRVEIVFYEPVTPEESFEADPHGAASGLDDEGAQLLAEVAATIRHMPRPARQALSHQMQLWRDGVNEQRSKA